MKRWFILFLTIIFVSPVMADRPKLRGPSRPKPKQIVKINTIHNCSRFHGHQIRRYSRSKSYTYYFPQPITIIVQPRVVLPAQPKQQPQTIKPSRHKTIYINPKSQRTIPRVKTRNQILRESREKVRPRVYNTNERKQ